jgi:hypothetical protein
MTLTRDQWIATAVLSAGAIWYLANKTASDTEDALTSGASFKCKLTNYHPYDVGNAAEKVMEGGKNDRVGNPLHTLEDFLGGNAPYVSVSGDDAIFPYGQRLVLETWPDVIFRVVDTGGHFSSAEWAIKKGFTKVYRVAGYEPLDICCATRDTSLAPTLTRATIVNGDTFAANYPNQRQDVNTDPFQGQTVG